MHGGPLSISPLCPSRKECEVRELAGHLQLATPITFRWWGKGLP